MQIAYRSLPGRRRPVLRTDREETPMLSPLNRLVAIAMLLALVAGDAIAQQKFTPPASPRTTYNFNPGWKFIKQEVDGSEAPEFDDSKWENVSTPHTYNDVD